MNSLGPHHRRVLATAFAEIHRHLAAFEAMMDESRRQDIVSEYEDDLSASERDLVNELFTQIRRSMSELAEQYNLHVQSRPMSLKHALLSGLTLLNVTVADLGPRRLRGYGQLDEAATRDLHQIEVTLSRLVHRLCVSLRQSPS